jgi:hypothetical protein
MRRARIAGVLLVILGVLTLGTGTYFLFLRPPLLPEDLRFTGIDPKLLDPRMITWLGIVFRTGGGFVTGFGILLSAVGWNLLSARVSALRWGASAAILVAFGHFLASNLVLHSDHLPFIFAMFAIAVVAASQLLRRSGGD